MTLKMINLSTGPVGILPNVMDAMAELPVSHRNPDFQDFTNKTAKLFCDTLNVKRTYFLTGSGTLGNELMIQQIKIKNQKGVVLINGEFGRRLAEQSKLSGLDLIEYSIVWGEKFEISKISDFLIAENASWILFCHNETSTGVINPLTELGNLAKEKGYSAYADCMSSMGTLPIDLSNITMATASSGKGQGAIAGISLVFSNYIPSPSLNIARYIDLGVYEQKNGVPFTISSNLLKAVGIGAQNNLSAKHWDNLDKYSDILFNALAPKGFIPFASKGERVFTIVPKGKKSTDVERELLAKGIELSCRSEYLIKRNWIQLALFGHYTEDEIKFVTENLLKALS